MELLFLALFAVSLIACVVTGASVVFALVFGYILRSEERLWERVSNNV